MNNICYHFHTFKLFFQYSDDVVIMVNKENHQYFIAIKLRWQI